MIIVNLCVCVCVHACVYHELAAIYMCVCVMRFHKMLLLIFIATMRPLKLIISYKIMHGESVN